MKLRLMIALACTFLVASSLSAAKPSHTLKEVEGAPKGLSKKVTALLSPNGHQVTGPDGVVCVIWTVKEAPIKEKFKPSLSVAYPFQTGELLGAIQFPEGTYGLDFRGQEIPEGVYTLRYGQQPEDGNHLGTSEIRDFCLALPAKRDVDPKPLSDQMRLATVSADSAGTTHPAIFLMGAPPEKPEKAVKLIHDEDKDQWLLQLSLTGKAKGKSVPMTVRIVTVGMGE